jgi:hypothetical protein
MVGGRCGAGVLRRDIAEPDRLRRRIVARWGDQALLSLALTMAASRVYPSLKYAWGHGHACTRVSLAGGEVTVSH